MKIDEFSVKRDGDRQLTKNFKIREFRCRDGTDYMKIDVDLVKVVQKLRDKLNKPIVVTSGYRTVNHNKNCGGAKNSYHLKGRAIDLFCNGVKAIEIARWFYDNGVKGIGLYINRSKEFVHIDSRDTKYFWVQDGNITKQVNKF